MLIEFQNEIILLSVFHRVSYQHSNCWLFEILKLKMLDLKHMTNFQWYIDHYRCFINRNCKNHRHIGGVNDLLASSTNSHKCLRHLKCPWPVGWLLSTSICQNLTCQNTVTTSTENLPDTTLTLLPTSTLLSPIRSDSVTRRRTLSCSIVSFITFSSDGTYSTRRWEMLCSVKMTSKNFVIESILLKDYLKL